MNKNLDTSNLIAVVCYDEIEYWHSRKNAMDFYREGARSCEGCEAERYSNIFFDLFEGNNIASDGHSRTYELLVILDKYLEVDSPDGTRDYDNKIWPVKW